MKFDAVVIGSGPNGLAAAITLARVGLSVCVREAAETIGGGMRSAALTLPGFTHDICSTIQGLAQTSPFFKSLPLKELGVQFDFPNVSFAQAMDHGGAVLAEGSVEQTAKGLGKDRDNYRKLFGPLEKNWDKLVPMLLAPPIGFPAHPVLMGAFGLKAIRSAQSIADAYFKTPEARALFAGCAAHAILPFDKTASASFGMVLTASAHAGGWPVARGGSQKLADAMVNYLQNELKGTVVAGAPVTTLDEFPADTLVLCDVAPRTLLKIAGDKLPGKYRKRLETFHHGPAAFKMDWALSRPIPWTNADLFRAGTVHLGGTFEEIAQSEADSFAGRVPQKPYVLLVQSSLFDATRAPAGQHTAWGYCHVPPECTQDMTDAIEGQIERFAPGFRDCVLARSVRTPGDLERDNANLVGGDITGGANLFSQILARPIASTNPYRTPIPNVFLCSASTSPGGGVHGMCGYHAAQSALRWKKIK